MKRLLTYLEERKYWGNEAAGTIFVADDTNRILFIKRSAEEDSEQGEWEMTVGGKKDDFDIDVSITRDREAFEEIGIYPTPLKTRYLQLFFDTGDDHEPFKYSVFVKLLPKEFIPKLSDEHTDYKWVDIKKDQIPSPTHFGVSQLLKHPDAERYFK